MKLSYAQRVVLEKLADGRIMESGPFGPFLVGDRAKVHLATARWLKRHRMVERHNPGAYPPRWRISETGRLALFRGEFTPCRAPKE